MVKRDKERKSSRLLELEDVFERRTRRFSPFEVLGLKPEANTDVVPAVSSEEPDVDKTSKSLTNRPTPGSTRPSLEKADKNPPMGGSDGPIYGVGKPSPGVGKPTRVVVDTNITTTIGGLPTPDLGLPDPPLGLSNGPTHGSHENNIRILPSGDIQTKLQGSHPKKSSEQSKFLGVESRETEKLQQENVEGERPSATQVTDLITAAQIGGQLGVKARQVLQYLNSIRSLEHHFYTMPVGYGQISSVASVDPDYLRRKVLPKLAMLGLIGIARRSLDGTVYHLPHDLEYMQAVLGNYANTAKPSTGSQEENPTKNSDASFVWPDWIDRQRWGWLSQETIERLIQKAGSDIQAREKLDIITYNEMNGTPQQRVRNRRSVLAHYLASPQAEIWPNDEGFETLSLRQARLNRERAQQEKAMAEEALRDRQAAEKIRFVASLLDEQRRWISQEAKRLVDRRPDSKFLSSRYPLYKAEEERLFEEWLERTKFGESIPEAGDPE